MRLSGNPITVINSVQFVVVFLVFFPKSCASCILIADVSAEQINGDN